MLAKAKQETELWLFWIEAASKIYFFDGKSTKIWLLPGLVWVCAALISEQLLPFILHHSLVNFKRCRRRRTVCPTAGKTGL